MADLLTQIRAELDERRAALRPSVLEYERLLRAADALAGVPLATARPAVATPPPPPRQRAAKPKAAAGGRARPGQTQQRVIDVLREAPGSTSVAVAKAVGISTNAAAATISRLVKQGRVRRRDEGGYAAAEPAPAGAPPPAPAQAVTPDPAPAAPDDVNVAPAPAPDVEPPLSDAGAPPPVDEPVAVTPDPEPAAPATPDENASAAPDAGSPDTDPG